MATYNVTNSNNSGSGSLRRAIKQANSNPGKDDIFVQVDVELTKEIKITDSVFIGTPYGSTITLIGDNVTNTETSQRIFNIDNNKNTKINVSLFRLNLTGGDSQTFGGAIFSRENLTITDSKIYHNTAKQGGGIYQTGGSLYLERTRIYNNQIRVANSDEFVPGGLYVDSKPTLINSIIDVTEPVLDNTDNLELNELPSIQKQDSSQSEAKKFDFVKGEKDSLTGSTIDTIQPVDRFLNIDTGAFSYTINDIEQNYIEDNLSSYQTQGSKFYTFESQPENLETIPVYRIFNSQSDSHLYNTDLEEIQYTQDNISGFATEGE